MGECLSSLGYDEVADQVSSAGERIRRHRWQLRFATGFVPEDIVLPKRYYKVTTWKGPVDAEYLDTLRREYGRRLTRLVKNE